MSWFTYVKEHPNLSITWYWSLVWLLKKMHLSTVKQIILFYSVSLTQHFPFKSVYAYVWTEKYLLITSNLSARIESHSDIAKYWKKILVGLPSWEITYAKPEFADMIKFQANTLRQLAQKLLLTLMKKEKHRVYDNKESPEKSKSPWHKNEMLLTMISYDKKKS